MENATPSDLESQTGAIRPQYWTALARAKWRCPTPHIRGWRRGSLRLAFLTETDKDNKNKDNNALNDNADLLDNNARDNEI